jgi:hypothetical protein
MCVIWISDARHTARAESGQGRLGIDARHDQGSTVAFIAECGTLEAGDADIPDLQSPPPMNRGSGYMSGSETAAGVSTVSLARPSRPSVAMITVAAGSRSGPSSSITGSLWAIGFDHFIDHFVNDLAGIFVSRVVYAVPRAYLS